MRGSICVLRPFRHKNTELRVIEAQFAGKLWAFAAVDNRTGKRGGWALGVFVANKAIYTIVDPMACLSDTYEEMSTYAEDLNKYRGLTRAMTVQILRGDRLSEERIGDWLAHINELTVERDRNFGS
jgi:hypothetical protein